MKKLNDEEASFNGSLYYRQNLIFELKKISLEKINYMSNNNLKDHIIEKTDLNEFQEFDLFFDNSTKEENQGQIENFQSSSKSLARLYFINKNNINDSLHKEEKKLLNKKRKKEKIFFSKKISNKNKLFRKFNYGRKFKEDKNIRKHNSSSKDNIMNKIKTHFFHYIRDIIKKNCIYETINFIKFRREFVANLKKDKNMDLLETKLIDILKNQPISTKNKNADEYENKFIIDKIYEEKKEKKVMNILELTFKELFIIFRRKLNKHDDKKELKNIDKKIKELDLIANNEYDDISYLIKDIKEKNSRDNKMTEEELKEYINKVLMACNDYEKWFYEKVGRHKKLIK